MLCGINRSLLTLQENEGNVHEIYFVFVAIITAQLFCKQLCFISKSLVEVEINL